VRWTALPLLAASLTRDPALISGITLTSFLPWFLLSLLSGALVDRIDRRKAMGVANVLRAGLVAGLGIAIMVDVATIYLLYAVGFLMGSAETVSDNAAQAILPSLVRRDQLEKANGRMYAAEIVTNQFAGPPLGGFLFAAAAAMPFFVDSATFAISALLVLSFTGTFRGGRKGGIPEGTIRQDIVEGLRWLWGHRLIRTFAIMLGVWNGISTAGQAIFVLFALEILGLDELGYGLVLSAITAGSLVGSIIAPRLSKLGAGKTLIAQVFLGALSALGIAVTSNPFVVAAMLVVSGVTIVVWNVITVSLRQSIIPDHLLGRVNSVYRLMGWGSMPIGAAVGGFLAAGFGLRAPFFVESAVLFAMALAAVPVINDRTIREARATDAP
jgi:MFS family permease